MSISPKAAFAAATFGVLSISTLVLAQESGVRAERADSAQAPAMSPNARMTGMMHGMMGMMAMMNQCTEMGMMQECMKMMNECTEKMDAMPDTMPDTSKMEPAPQESDTGLRPSEGTDRSEDPRAKPEIHPMRGAGNGPADTGGDDEGSRGRNQ